MEEGTSPATTRKARAAVLFRRRSRSAALMKITREPPLKQLMKYAVPAVLALLLLRHQRQPDALFRENPVPLWSFVAATAVYWLAAEAMTSYRRRMQQLILRRGAVAFGVLSALSLVSMFLHHPFSLLPLLTRMLAALLSAFAWIRTPLMTAIGKVRGMVVRNRGVDPKNHLPTLAISLSHN